jgi:hypothetical protein
MLVLVPLIACRFSISLCFESRAFESATVQMATEYGQRSMLGRETWMIRSVIRKRRLA